MRPSSILIPLSATLVAADFKIFAMTDNSVENGGSTYTSIMFFNSSPSCSDVLNAVPVTSGQEDNDASKNGYACDGCTLAENTQDWNITRFEFYDGPDASGSATDNPQPITNEALGHVTLYQDRGYSISYVSLDGTQSGTRGSCQFSTDQYLDNCQAVVDVYSGYKIFDCTTDLTIIKHSDGGVSGN